MRSEEAEAEAEAEEDVSGSDTAAPGQGDGVQAAEDAPGDNGDVDRRYPRHPLHPPLPHPGERGAQVRILMAISFLIFFITSPTPTFSSGPFLSFSYPRFMIPAHCLALFRRCYENFIL